MKGEFVMFSVENNKPWVELMDRNAYEQSRSTFSCKKQ